MEPWGLGSRFGQWYLVGHDRARGAKRLLPALPPDVRRDRAGQGDLHAAGRIQRPRRAGRPAGAARPERRRRRRSTGSCWGSASAPSRFRHAALALTRAEAGAAGRPAAGWDRLAVPFRDAETLGEELASYGPRVAVVSPARTGRAPCAAAWPPPPSSPRPRPLPSPSLGFPAGRPGQARRKRTSEDQLKRMLQLVPFLVHNQGLHISEVAARFGVTRKELEERPADPDLLRPAGGVPGRTAGHPVGRRPRLHHPGPGPEPAGPVHRGRGLRPADRAGDAQRPARTRRRRRPGVGDAQAHGGGGGGGAEGGLALRPGGGARRTPPSWTTAREAIRTGAQLRLTYFSPQRDAVSERDVDPLRLYSLDNTWYLEAYCHSAPGAAQLPAGPDRRASQPNGRPVSADGQARRTVFR